MATTTGATPRPGSLPPPSQTVDSTGFVDNAGRTSDQRDRTELSGMRATETGSHVPTGTPGSGLPLPIEPAAPPRPPEAPRVDAMAIDPAPRDGTVLGAVLEAVTFVHCDRERRCGRLEPARGDECRASVGSRYREELGAADCAYSFDVDDVVACLSAIRDTPCEIEIEDVSRLAHCRAPVLCLPR